MSICPKNKSSKARRDKRRANWKMSAPNLVKCSKCGALMMPHRVCKACGSSYHTEYKKPAEEGICNACGGELVRRKDDAPETVLERLKVYHEETEPLKEFYASKGKLVIVEGQEDVEDTTALTLKALED